MLRPLFTGRETAKVAQRLQNKKPRPVVAGQRLEINEYRLFPLYTANGLRRQVVADAADARNFGGNAFSDALQQRPVKLGNLGGHNINGVDAANDAGRLLGSMQSSFEFGWNTS